MAILPYENDYQLNVVILGTTESPGVVVLDRHERQLNWENKQAKGNQGASSKLQGGNIGEFDMTFYLAGDTLDEDGRSDFQRWEEFEALLWSTVNGPRPFALPIYHPDLARNKYTEVTLKTMGGMKYDSTGGATVKVTVQEYKPETPKPAAKPQSKASTTTAKKDKPDPNAAAKKEVADLLKKAREP